MSTRLFDLCDHGLKLGLSSRIQTPYLSTNPISHYKHGDPNLRVFLKFEIRGSRTQRYLGEILRLFNPPSSDPSLLDTECFPKFGKKKSN